MKMFYHVLLSYLKPAGIVSSGYSENNSGIEVTLRSSTHESNFFYGTENLILSPKQIKELAYNVVGLLTPRAPDGL